MEHSQAAGQRGARLTREQCLLASAALVYAVERRHRNVRVRRVTSRGEDSSTQLPAAAGEGPDVAVMHVDRIPINAAHETILSGHDLGLVRAGPAGAVRGHR